MQRVPITKVKPGMILAKPVSNEKGMALLAESTELTANIIEKLKKMDVRIVTLKGHPVDMGIPEVSPEEKLSRIEEKFEVFKGNPVMERLKDAIERAILAADAEEDGDEEEGQHGLTTYDKGDSIDE